jgi:voltage-gated potassium channel
MTDKTTQVVEVVEPGKPHSFDLFVAVTGIISLTLLSWRLFLDPMGNTVELIDLFDLGTCVIFFLDFLRKLAAAKSKIKYLLTWGPIDLLASVPAAQFANVSIIHTLQLPHVFRMLQGIRAIKSIHAIAQAVRKDHRNAMVVTGFLIAELTIVGCCFAVLHFESQDPSANIKNAADVLWWSFVTMSTVGYGDLYPVTIGGRFMAVLLMFVGIGLFAMLAGVFADSLRSAATEITTKSKK